MPSLRPALSVLLLLATAACGNAAAAPRAVVVPAAAPPASVALVQRLAAAEVRAMPAVTGLSVAAARRRLAGIEVQVVGFGKKGVAVTAQWPSPGAPRPSDAAVVWVGQPPAPPKPAKAAPSEVVTTGPAPQLPAPPPVAGAERGADSAPAVAPAPTVMPRVGGPGSGVTPGLESFVAPPHAPRANIRTLPPAEPGTALSGRASWYGPGFEGRGTACGTTFDPAQLTLASRELRCGTTVTVTGPAGSVEATVTDWGPAEWTNRRFDLSQATFAAVAPLGSGVIDVTVEAR